MGHRTPLEAHNVSVLFVRQRCSKDRGHRQLFTGNTKAVEQAGGTSPEVRIDVAQQLRGDAVETVMQTADFRNDNDATD
jgi:hypothetical protein